MTGTGWKEFIRERSVIAGANVRKKTEVMREGIA
jgi:hypothetical protein